VCELFEEEPNIQLYPSYYDLVAKPIALDTVDRRTMQFRYRDESQFLDDLGLLRNNAYAFNAEGSLVRNFADIILSTAQRLLGQDTGKDSASSSSSDVAVASAPMADDAQ